MIKSCIKGKCISTKFGWRLKSIFLHLFFNKLNLPWKNVSEISISFEFRSWFCVIHNKNNVHKKIASLQGLRIGQSVELHFHTSEFWILIHSLYSMILQDVFKVSEVEPISMNSFWNMVWTNVNASLIAVQF